MRTSTEALNLGFESGQGSCYFAACTSRHKAAGQVRLSKVASSQMYLDPNPPKRARTAAQTLEAPPTPTTLTAILTCVVTPRAGQVKATRCPVWPPVSPWSHGPPPGPQVPGVFDPGLPDRPVSRQKRPIKDIRVLKGTRGGTSSLGTRGGTSISGASGYTGCPPGRS